MPPLNRCSARRPRWPHVQCTGRGWPQEHWRGKPQKRGHAWWGLFRWLR